MPLAKDDILNVLSDPHLSRIDFWVENLHVTPAVWVQVRDSIEHDQIFIVPGKYPDNAFYNDSDDTLTTPDVNPPPGPDSRGLIIHECTHAYVDTINLDITNLSEEIAAYLVQHTYLLLLIPTLVGPTPNAPWPSFFRHLIDFCKTFKLHQTEGQGARLNLFTIAGLRAELNTLPSPNDYYRRLKWDQRGGSNGLTQKIRVRQLEREPINISVASLPHLASYAISDSLLVEILEKRYAANDVVGFGGRVKRLEQLFRGANPLDARMLVPRLVNRRNGDKVSMYFHDHLSTATRTNLLGILQLRAQ
jgi:hypothetical protein